MPPKRGTKRKASNGTFAEGNADLAPPDRATWPGWVEMESEPAFFNVMLKEMGVQGAKVQEVYGLDDEMLAFLPQPVHALIFLFRYRDADEALGEKGTDCPSHVWFANQIPDFACATVALLNIVNNIDTLDMGKELRDFKYFTRDMEPLKRGDAIDRFDFVKKIHNSFARENDLLVADMHCKQKANRAKKRQALAKARETREAKKAGKTPLKELATNGTHPPERASPRTLKETTKSTPSASISVVSSPLSSPPDSDQDFDTPSKSKKPEPETNGDRRRSSRKPKPRQDINATKTSAVGDDDEEGFHFIAYMPIKGHVWRMDGLDSFPQDMGTFDSTTGGDWMSIAQSALQLRMAMYEGQDIEFNLMAVVQDPIVNDRRELMKNVKTVQTLDKKLDDVFEDWRALDGAETKKDIVTGASLEFGISELEVGETLLAREVLKELDQDDDLLRLVNMRKKILSEQPPLRGAVRDAMQAANEDEERARHRRHDYGTFVRSWLNELAENELLDELLEIGG